MKESATIQEFGNERFFHECSECPSSSTTVSHHYLGFNLTNHGGSSRYGALDDREDCQRLCDLANGCNFFTFDKESGDCYLKYGVGEKLEEKKAYFGRKSPQEGRWESEKDLRKFWEPLYLSCKSKKQSTFGCFQECLALEGGLILLWQISR